MPGDEFYHRLFRPNEAWDMDIEAYGYNDPGELINLFANDAFNDTHYHDPKLIRQIRAASAESGPRASCAPEGEGLHALASAPGHD
jgi:hypothetical protein